jgi:hypothetical protein
MATAHTAHAECLSCGASLEGAFCSCCGEPAAHQGDLRLRHLTHDFLHEFTHLDGKIWRTLRALFFAPGCLTAEYWAGRRGPWIRPLRLYLVITALQLILASNASGPLGLRVWSDRAGQNFMVGQKLQKTETSLVNEEVSHRIQTVYLWVRYLSLGIFSAASLLVYRKQQPYFGAHMIFALHYYAFLSVIAGVTLRVAPGASAVVIVTSGFAYLFLALRRVYRQKFFITLGRSICLYAAVAIAESIILGATVMVVIKFWPHHG